MSRLTNLPHSPSLPLSLSLSASSLPLKHSLSHSLSFSLPLPLALHCSRSTEWNLSKTTQLAAVTICIFTQLFSSSYSSSPSPLLLFLLAASDRSAFHLTATMHLTFFLFILFFFSSFASSSHHLQHTVENETHKRKGESNLTRFSCLELYSEVHVLEVHRVALNSPFFSFSDKST